MIVKFWNKKVRGDKRHTPISKEFSIVISFRHLGDDFNVMNSIAGLLNVKLKTLFDLDITSFRFLGKIFLKIYKNSNSKFVKEGIILLLPRFVKLPSDGIIIFSTSGELVPKGNNIVPYIHTPVRAFSDYYDEYKKSLRQRNILVFVIFPLLKFIYNQWYKYALGRTYVRFVNSETTRERMMRYYLLPTIVLDPFIDTNSFYNESYSRYFLSVSRFERAKNLNFLINAFERFKKQNEDALVIAGGAVESDQKKYYDELKEYVEKRNLNVTLIANPNEKEIKKTL
ncbi:MAG: glycosyltransferase [Candidatus Jordarchaeaceae archaeon]